MVTGIVNIYKEKGWTSFDVVARMRRLFQQKKIGHTGTLDPDATGVLPVCLGKATGVCDLLTDRDKVYEAVLLLGKRTDTQDISGNVIAESRVSVDQKEVEEAILSFRGPYEQVPPMYSALKVNGHKLCDLARAGITVERKSRRVEIYDIRILRCDLPRVHMVVACSKGTYIRTLCDDIGEKLGCHGCMESLVRTKAGSFSLENAITLKQLEQMLENDDLSAIIPVDSVFMDLKPLTVREEGRSLMENGNKLPLEFVEFGGKREEERYRLYDAEGNFIGVYQLLKEEERLKPVKIFRE